jgi:hypothetical protein
MFLHQVTDAGRRDLVAEFSQLTSDPDVAPGILAGHPQRQRFSGLGFGRSAWPLGGVVEGPLPSLHPPVPSQQCFRADDGNDLPQPIFDRHGVVDQGAAIRLGQRHSFAQLAAQNLASLTEEIIFLGQIFAEELLNPGDERSGRAVKRDFIQSKLPDAMSLGDKKHRNAHSLRASEYLHSTRELFPDKKSRGQPNRLASAVT